MADFDPELAREVFLKHARVPQGGCLTCGPLPFASSTADHLIAEYEKAKKAKDNNPKKKWRAVRAERADLDGQWLLYKPEGGGWLARTGMFNPDDAKALMERIADLLNADDDPKQAPLTEQGIHQVLGGTLPDFVPGADIAIAARRLHEKLSQ